MNFQMLAFVSPITSAMVPKSVIPHSLLQRLAERFARHPSECFHPFSRLIGIRQSSVRPDFLRGSIGIPVSPVFQLFYGQVIIKCLGNIVQPVMPDKLPDELPDNVLQWYRKPFRKINRNPKQSRFRPVMMAEQTEMQPSVLLFQIDTTHPHVS